MSHGEGVRPLLSQALHGTRLLSTGCSGRAGYANTTPCSASSPRTPASVAPPSAAAMACRRSMTSSRRRMAAQPRWKCTASGSAGREAGGAVSRRACHELRCTAWSTL